MLVVHAKCTAQLPRGMCEMSGHGNWWVRSMKTPSLGNSACAKIGERLAGPALSSGFTLARAEFGSFWEVQTAKSLPVPPGRSVVLGACSHL